MSKIIGNTTAITNPQSDWAQNNSTKADYIKNKSQFKYYYTDFITAVMDLNDNDFAEASEKTADSVVCITVSDIGNPVIDLLKDATISEKVGITVSSTFNLNGHTLSVNKNSMLGFRKVSGATEITLNAEGATIQRTGTPTSSNVVLLYCDLDKMTINGGTYKEYNGVNECHTIQIKGDTSITEINNATMYCAAMYLGNAISILAGSSVTLNNVTAISGAYLPNKTVYSADQTLSYSIYAADSLHGRLNIVGGDYSGECMAARLYNPDTYAYGASFESCDHGVYFSGSFANFQNCTFQHRNWINLSCNSLEYPFADSTHKTLYTEANPSYANLGLCYIGGAATKSKVILNGCTEFSETTRTDAIAKIVLKTTDDYYAPTLYLSNHTITDSIRVDGDNGYGSAKLFVGKNVSNLVIYEQDNSGIVDDSTYSNVVFCDKSDIIIGKEDVSNKVTSISSESTDTQYPSAKAAYEATEALDEKIKRVDYTYLPKYRTGASHLLDFGGFTEPSTEYQIAHLSEVIDCLAMYYFLKDDEVTYIKPELITDELKAKYHVSSDMGNDARYYIPITDELIVLEYYISSTEAYYYLHTSADSIGTIEQIYVGKASELIDDNEASNSNLWTAQKTKECVDTKLDKITTTDGYNRAYGVSYAGEQMSFRVANSAISSALAQRDSNGNIKVGMPVEDEDATPKSYVDGKVDKVTSTSTSNRLYGISPSGEQKVFTGSYTPNSGSFPMYSGTGTLRTNSPSENTHCANKEYVDDTKPIQGGTSDPVETIDAKFLGRLYMNEATGEMFYAAQNIASGSYEWRSIISKALKQTSAPTGAGYLGQLCLVGSSDFSPYDVYICVYSDPVNNAYIWHKMCTTEAPA